MTTLDVLGTLRAIRDDEALTTVQAHFLVCAVLRADNKTCRVRMSVEGLSKDAGIGYSTARTCLKTDAVTRYFEVIERSGRQVNLTLYRQQIALSPDTVLSPDTTPPGESTTPPGPDTLLPISTLSSTKEATGAKTAPVENSSSSRKTTKKDSKRDSLSSSHLATFNRRAALENPRLVEEVETAARLLYLDNDYLPKNTEEQRAFMAIVKAKKEMLVK